MECFTPIRGCAVPYDFIGKVESMEEDWAHLLSPLCGSNVSFNDSLGLHPNDDQDKGAMEIVLNWKTDDPPADHASAMAILLQEGEGRYLRALCWLLLVDFVTLKHPNLTLTFRVLLCVDRNFNP